MSEQYEKDFVRLSANLKKIALALNDRAVTIRLARKCREIIYRRLKSGYGVDNDKEDAESVNRKQLKQLSSSYIAWRKGLVVFYKRNGKLLVFGKEKAEYFTNYETGQRTRVSKRKNPKIDKPKLGEFGRPEKSNATLSGQMLNAMVFNANQDGFKIFINDTKRRPVTKHDKSNLTNKQVAEYYFKNRPGLALTDGEVRILKQECELIVREKIRQLIR